MLNLACQRHAEPDFLALQSAKSGLAVRPLHDGDSEGHGECQKFWDPDGLFTGNFFPSVPPLLVLRRPIVQQWQCQWLC